MARHARAPEILDVPRPLSASATYLPSFAATFSDPFSNFYSVK